ncbi:hypothetical protein PILCRDRAFT_12866 [Piloderma croceum F 1598]|uniref:Uncharacterized protein n=1 Tax=Piloderma croceum (strain F 1598) TaxID=765440 RepID=A0A0C3AQQ4_PILCF|nr:hypothetical protein PILCRDRAFT_12866 [Piloderma croceum F 1598]
MSQGEGAVNYAEDIDSKGDDRMVAGGTAGAMSDAAGMKEHAHEHLPFSWETLSHEERKVLRHDLLSRGSAFCCNSTPRDADETSEIHMLDETQGTHASLCSSTLS